MFSANLCNCWIDGKFTFTFTFTLWKKKKVKWKKEKNKMAKARWVSIIIILNFQYDLPLHGKYLKLSLSIIVDGHDSVIFVSMSMTIIGQQHLHDCLLSRANKKDWCALSIDKRQMPMNVFGSLLLSTILVQKKNTHTQTK